MTNEDKQMYVKLGKEVGKNALWETGKYIARCALVGLTLTYGAWAYDQGNMNPTEWNWQEVREQTGEGLENLFK